MCCGLGRPGGELDGVRQARHQLAGWQRLKALQGAVQRAGEAPNSDHRLRPGKALLKLTGERNGTGKRKGRQRRNAERIVLPGLHEFDGMLQRRVTGKRNGGMAGLLQQLG